MLSSAFSNIVELLLILGCMHIKHKLFLARSKITSLVMNLLNGTSDLLLNLMDCLLLLVRVKIWVVNDPVSELV